MKWKYDGYTKVHDSTRKRMTERWRYVCPSCGYIISTEAKPAAIKQYVTCPGCKESMHDDPNPFVIGLPGSGKSMTNVMGEHYAAEN